NDALRIGKECPLQVADGAELAHNRGLVQLRRAVLFAAEGADRDHLLRPEALEEGAGIFHGACRVKQYHSRTAAGGAGGGELQRVVLGKVAGEEDGALSGGTILAGPLQGLGAAALEPAQGEEDEDGRDGKGDKRPGGEMAHGDNLDGRGSWTGVPVPVKRKDR